MSYMCGKCKKTREQLIEENKLNLVQGYEQCADCHGDLEHQSVIEREDLWKKARKMAVKHVDYEEKIHPLDKEVMVKTPNTFKYLPQWYKDELLEGQQGIYDMFRNLHKDDSDYNQIID